MIRPILICLASILGLYNCHAQTITLSSPSGNIQIEINNTNQLTYRVLFNKKLIIDESPMGFQFKNEPDMGKDLVLLGQKEEEINDSWSPVIKSKHAVIADHYKSLQVHFVEQSGLRRKMDVEFRAYNDGIAFRYQLFPIGRIGDRNLSKELTGFNFVGDPKAWIADNRIYNSHQEMEFIPGKISLIKDSTKAGLPFLVEVDKGCYAAITEAKVDNYPGFYLGIDQGTKAQPGKLVTKLSPLPYEPEDGIKARFSDRLYTPWRVVMLAENPGRLIESEIIQNLNDPCVLKDVSWIKPGMSAWDNWWTDDVKQDMPTIKKYIDLASVQKWPYMIVDWKWYGEFDNAQADITQPAPQLNMPDLLSYAKNKNVRLWLWLFSKDLNRNDQMEKAFALYEKWGIAGVKIDFMEREDQEMVNWYRKVIQKAADHHLLVDFHGAYKPDGIIRTYPNMITREGVMGEEYAKFSNKLTPEHNITLAFTRMLAGQMDYTPGGFLNVTKAKFKQGSPTVVMNTRCAELAKFVIYESPLTVYCDHPDHILNQPGADFLNDIPTVWDDIHFLAGYPAEHIELVKRSGNQYFVGGMNNSTGRVIKLKLDFLPVGKYKMLVWADAKDADINPTQLINIKRLVNHKSVIPIKMAIGGGFVMKIVPADPY